MTVARRSAPIRGTQSMIGYMSWVSRRPLLTIIEVGWRWAVGIPLLLICWAQWQAIVAAHTLEDSGFFSIDTQNPWLAVVQIANVWSYYLPHVLAVLRWLVPLGALAWIVLSGCGRSLLLKRMKPDLPFRFAGMIALQAASLALAGVFFWLWFASVQWAASTHIGANGEPDLVGYAIWTIVLTLAFFTAFALVSWALSIAPLLYLLERRTVLSSLVESLRLGNAFTGKLAEINLVMGIVKLALIVVAMVLSAAPLPFSDELGSGAMHAVLAASTIFYLVANDYFHVVRLKGFIEFWQVYRGTNREGSATAESLSS
jgi:hypothetical protein